MQSYVIREFVEKDLDQIEKINHMLWLSIQYKDNLHKENCFVAVNEDEEVLGVSALSFDGTWYYIEKNREDIPLYRMQIDLNTKDGIEDEENIIESLVTKLKMRLKEFKKKYPDKKLCIRSWCYKDEEQGQQFWLKQGFGAWKPIWILKYDLSNQIPEYSIPDNIKIGVQSFDEDGMKAYFTANELGFENVQDAEADICFILGDPESVCYTAKDGDKVVASTMVWRIEKGRSATENVFTIPDYRHQNIGRATVAYALKQLKDRGDEIATLTCVGDNIAALSMYFGMGFELMGHLVELHYEI